MQVVPMHPLFQAPQRSTTGAGAYDLFMPVAGKVHARMNWASPTHQLVGLGFAAKVPEGCVAMIMPRSGAGAKHGIELRNTVGIIDSDYTGEWMVAVKQKEGGDFSWAAGERLFQYVIVPVVHSDPVIVDSLATTERDAGGFGSTGA